MASDEQEQSVTINPSGNTLLFVFDRTGLAELWGMDFKTFNIQRVSDRFWYRLSDNFRAINRTSDDELVIYVENDES